MGLGRRVRIIALFAALATAPLVARLPEPQPAQPPPVKLQPPILIGPGMPVDMFADFMRYEWELDRLFRKPCLTAQEQSDALAKAKSWIEWLRKFAKDYALTDVAKQEANDYAALLLAKYQRIQNMKICPPGGAGTAPVPPKPVSNPGGGTGGSGTGPGGTTTPDDKPCDDAKKDRVKEIAAAREKFAVAQSALLVIDEQLGELSTELAEKKKLVSEWDAEQHGPAKSMEDVQKERDVIDARKRIGDIEAEMRQLNKARGDANRLQDEALEELRKYGVDPFGECPSQDDLKMPTFGANLEVPPQAALAAAFDTVDLASDAVANPLAAGNVCCEPGVQKLMITIALRRRPAPPKAQTVRARDWVDALARLIRGFPVAALQASSPAAIQVAAARRAGSVQAVITSLGESQGEAFQLRILNEGSRPIRLAADGVVVEPIKRAARDEAEKALEGVTAKLKNAAPSNVEGYCLMHGLNPPAAGTLFRVAPPAVQAQFAQARAVVRAATMLERSNVLTPDSDPQAYVESIKQYAIWTRLEKWDVRKFSDAWVEMTKKRVAAMRGQWTGQMEGAMRSLVPGRWRDIQNILLFADAPAAGSASATTP